MLTRIRAKNFRLFKELDLELAKGLPTVLIGPNSSGKSSVMEILDIGSQVAQGLSLQVMFNVQRGGLREVQSRLGSEEIELEYCFATSVGELSYRFVAAAQAGGGVQFRDEEARHGPYRVLGKSYGTSDRQFRNRFKNPTPFDDDDSKNDPTTTAVLSDRAASTLWELEIQSKRGKNLSVDQHKVEESLEKLHILRQELQSIAIYPLFSTSPKWLSNDIREGPRTSVVIGPASVLDRTAQNLVNYLYGLSVHHPETWKRLVEQFQLEFPYVASFSFPPDAGGGRIALGWRDKRYPNTQMYAFQMSDGMLQFLCVLAATLISPHSASAIGLDEPDAHLHPSAALRVISNANSVSSHTPVLIATHSDRILDGLADPAESIRVCASDENGARIEKLDQPSINAFLEHYSASDLRRRGLMDPDNAEDRVRGPA